MQKVWLTLLLVCLACCIPWGHAYHPRLTRKGILLWQVQLSPDQCGKERWTPCYNVYSVNETHGDLVWFAFTTSSAAVKGMFLGRHSVYYTTWSGPGLYAVNPTNGHVRWQFPLDNWFRYWVKDIDLGSSASFGTSDEVRDHVYVTAAGPPARVYGVHTKSGSCQWEYKVQPSSATLADLAGPLEDIRGRGTVFMAVNQPASNSSFVQGLGISSGKVIWQSAALNSTQLAELELRVQHNVVLVTNAAADGIIAFDAQNGTQLWNRSGSFCRTPSPIADVYRGELLLSESCENLSGLNMVDVVTGKELWSGWSAPSSAVPLGNCSSVNQAAEHIVFGCSCWHGKSAQQPGKGAAADSRGPATAASRTSSSRRQGKAAAAAAVGVSTHSANGVCLYAISSRNGKLRWALPLVGNASFPAAAQQWDMAPLIHANMVVFLATDRVIAVDLLSGKLRWVLPLPKGEVLRPYEQPVVDADSSTLVLAAQVAGSNKTGLSGVSLKEGRLLWHKTVNGTVQRGAGPEDRAQELMVTGGRAYVEACRGSRCCLRALNVTTGKQRWGMCLDAVQGDDATHPHAQFAIWFITLLTIASIALLILGAGLVYLQRWSEERRILYGEMSGAAPQSPRRTYQPVARGSDSDDD